MSILAQALREIERTEAAASRLDAQIASAKKPARQEFHDAVAGNSDSNEWPAALAGAAFHGLAGEIVRAIEPHTEADPAAILIQFLAAFGNIVGRGPHYAVEGDQHHGNLFVVLVGDTAKGRKGTSWGRVRSLYAMVDDPWEKERVLGGLSSGEGLIHAVRDAIGDDPGEHDKRALVVEEEFAKVLRVIERDGNTLSAIVRHGWDRGDLRVMTKNPATATGAHISIVGHITSDELKRYLTRTESGNGFANRFIFICARRSKCLPEGGDPGDLGDYARRLAEAIGHARTLGRVTFDADARAIWHRVYPKLSAGLPGLLGSVTSRAEAQTVRLALLYALLDRSPHIQADHLKAALALWEYAEASAQFIFGITLGDPVADDIRRALQSAPAGLDRTDLRDLFKRHRSADEIERALTLLERAGLAAMQCIETGGRPREVWVSLRLRSLTSLMSQGERANGPIFRAS